MTGRRIVPLVALLVIVAGTAWFFRTFELVPRKEWIGPSGEARLRPFLAAERLAARMGMPARELRSLPEIDAPAPGGVLIVPDARQGFDRARIARLLLWVAGGGHLIVEAEPPRLDDPLLDALQVKRAKGAARERPAFPDAISLQPPAVEPRVQIADKLISFARGRGLVTVASSLHFARNESIGEHDHADLLWRLLTLTPARELQVFFLPQRLSLTRFLAEHAWPVLGAALVLLAAWLWRIAARFGPIAPDAPPARRRLLDHLRASGRYYWSQGLRGELVLAARDAALRRVARAQPDFAGSSLAERTIRLSALTGMSTEEAARFIGGGAMHGADFIRFASRARDVHAALDKGRA